MIVTFCYHEISEMPESRWAVSPSEFSNHLDIIKKKGFSLVTLDYLIENHSTDKSKLCAITFDDGRYGAFKYGAEILDKANCKATFYVCIDYLDGVEANQQENYSKFFSWDSARKLSEMGHTIGSHSVKHRKLSGLPREDLRYEMEESKIRIENEITGISCDHFAIPYGVVTENVIEMARMSGYKSVASIEDKVAIRDFNPFPIPRMDILNGFDLEKLFTRILK